MNASSKPKSSADRVRDFRARQRSKGLKLVQFWLPDTSTPEFKAEARRQSLLVSQSHHAKGDQAFIDSVASVWWDNED